MKQSLAKQLASTGEISMRALVALGLESKRGLPDLFSSMAIARLGLLGLFIKPAILFFISRPLEKLDKGDLGLSHLASKILLESFSRFLVSNAK